MNERQRILILCTANSARSQMAEGLMRQEAGDRFEVFSAGSKPAGVRPEAITVMREIGIDLSGHRSKSVDEFIGQEFDYVITVCDNAARSCPSFPRETNRVDWPLTDPAAEEGSTEVRESAFRAARDQIYQKILEFLRDTL